MFSQMNEKSPVRVVEIGSGEGALACKIFKKWGEVPNGSCIDFVDKAACLSNQVKHDLEELGWSVTQFEEDIFRWGEESSDTYDLCFASLFLHHFEETELMLLFQYLSQKVKRFFCVEPRRDRFGLLGAAGLRLLRCDPVTLHDANVSVRAGFYGKELSSIWSQCHSSKWLLEERRAGMFSHFFSASSLTP
jgi:hypothetical protein